MEFDFEILFRFILAVAWGGLVGAEREYRGKSAGFRTTILISFGACFFTLMSTWIGAPDNGDRIASNIVTGIGFLGAGVIFRGENRISGITTAATIWAVAAVGMGIGAGYYFAAGCGSLLILFVLAVFSAFDQRIDQYNTSKMLMIRGKVNQEVLERTVALMEEQQVKGVLVKRIREAEVVSYTWQLQGRATHIEGFITLMMQVDFVDRVEC